MAEALRRDGVEPRLGVRALEALRDGDDYVLKLPEGTEVRGERLFVSTGRHPRVEGIGLETVGSEAYPHGIRVDEYLCAGERIWAIGDVNGIWPLTHVGEYEGDVVATNIAERVTQQLRGGTTRHLHRPPGCRDRRRGGALQHHGALIGVAHDRGRTPTPTPSRRAS
jgi:pyruvate/2-oxoglutarate dehydrogenase complex dihydrolipoamide dehydrogenase (E3) component